MTIYSLVVLLPNFESVSCSMWCSNCCFLTCIEVSQETGKVVWYSHLHKSFPQFIMIHTVKYLGVVDETEVDVFLEFPSFLYDSANVGNLISGSFASSKPRLYIWKFLVHVLLEPSLKDFDHNLTCMWNEHNQMIVWTFFGIALLWDWNENWPFPASGHKLSFSNLGTYWIQHCNSILF